MASNDSHRGRTDSSSSEKSENPFIRFRRFADAQIGAILQGIIGLPSVFSKPPHDANAKWPDIHDNSKPRDLCKEEKQAAESRGAETWSGSDEEEVEIPVRKFRGWCPSPESTRTPIRIEP